MTLKSFAGLLAGAGLLLCQSNSTQPIIANLAAAKVPEASGRVINVAMQDAHTINQLVEMLNELLSTEIEPIYGPPRPGDVPKSLADISLARQILGYEPAVGFEVGLQSRQGHVYRRAVYENHARPKYRGDQHPSPNIPRDRDGFGRG